MILASFCLLWLTYLLSDLIDEVLYIFVLSITPEARVFSALEQKFLSLILSPVA